MLFHPSPCCDFQSEGWWARDPERTFQSEPEGQKDQFTNGAVRSGRGSSLRQPSVLFRSSVDWTRPPGLTEGSLLALRSSDPSADFTQKPLKDTPRIMLSQMSGRSVAQSS